MATAYWIGNDGNVYAKGSNFSGVQNLGKAGGVVNQGRQVTHSNGVTTILPLSAFIANPGNPQPTASASSSGGGGGGGGGGGDYTGETQYWADQIGQLQSQLGRIPTQRQIGQQNIINSYNAAYSQLAQQQAQANRDIAQNKQNTINDNISAKNNIDDSVHQNLTGLQRLLASRGAGGGSAYSVLAPYAAATQGNQQRQQVQGTYAKNLQSIDLAQGDTDTKFSNAFGDLTSQRQNKENALNAQLAQTEAGIQQQLAQAAVSRTQAAGGNYGAARAAEAPYLARINQLLGAIDQAGAQVSFAPQAVAYTPPKLSTYTYDPTAQAALQNSGVAPGQQSQVGPYFSLLAGGQKKEDSPLNPANVSTQ
jgi:hypothetical protein